MFLRSEKKMKSELQGKWKREFLGDTSIHYNEFWNFNGDKLYTTYELLDPPDWTDDGTKDSIISDNVDTILKTAFKIDARTFRAYLKFQIIDRGINDTTAFVDKWEFVTLDKGVLYIAADNPDGTSVLQKEFSKVN
jgi:hypothetical protein